MYLAAKYGRLFTTSISEASGLSVVEDGGSLTLYGTQNEINAALTSVWYIAPLHWNSPGQGTFETLSILVNENNSTMDGEDDSYPGEPRTLLVLVVPVNDPPSIQGPPKVTAIEGRDTAIKGVEVRDHDAQETRGSSVKVTMTISEPVSVLQLGKTQGLIFSQESNESSPGNKTFQGSLANVNRALAGLVYRGPPEFSGIAELEMAISDMGNTGEGDAFFASVTTLIDVSSVNNKPRVIREGGRLRGPEDEAVKVEGVIVEDPDVLGGKIELTVEALHGTTSLGSDVLELEFVIGSGLRDTRVVVIGTLEVRHFDELSYGGYIFRSDMMPGDNIKVPHPTTSMVSLIMLRGPLCYRWRRYKGGYSKVQWSNRLLATERRQGGVGHINRYCNH